MFSFEKILIILICAVPVVALLMVLPKLKKKQKKEAQPIKTYEELKQEENKQEENQKEELKEKSADKIIAHNDFSPEDFKGYLNHREKDITKPKKVELPEGFVDTSLPFMNRKRRNQNKKPQTIGEEIQSLSPALKALIISGVLDKKNFD